MTTQQQEAVWHRLKLSVEFIDYMARFQISLPPFLAKDIILKTRSKLYCFYIRTQLHEAPCSLQQTSTVQLSFSLVRFWTILFFAYYVSFTSASSRGKHPAYFHDSFGQIQTGPRDGSHCVIYADDVKGFPIVSLFLVLFFRDGVSCPTKERAWHEPTLLDLQRLSTSALCGRRRTDLGPPSQWQVNMGNALAVLTFDLSSSLIRLASTAKDRRSVKMALQGAIDKDQK